MQVCPSILEYKAEDYIYTINKLSSYFSYFQIDIIDGVYVKNKTETIDNVLKILTSRQSLADNLQFDFHLMVKNYEREIKKLKRLRNFLTIKNVFIHFDLSPNYQLLTTHYPLFNIGLALNPQDQISDLTNQYNLKIISSIQIMSVIPGAQGKPFIPETLNKIEQLRTLGYRSKIFLDGAVNDKTLPIINSKKYFPDVICPGSFLAKSTNHELKKRVDYLLKFTNED